MDIRPRRPLLVSESHVFRKIAWVNSIQFVYAATGHNAPSKTSKTVNIEMIMPGVRWLAGSVCDVSLIKHLRLLARNGYLHYQWVLVLTSFVVVYKALLLLCYALGMGISLAFINLILRILTLSRLLPKKKRRSSQGVFSRPVFHWFCTLASAIVFGKVCLDVILSPSLLPVTCACLMCSFLLSSLAPVSLRLTLVFKVPKRKRMNVIDTGYAIEVVLLFVSKLGQILYRNPDT